MIFTSWSKPFQSLRLETLLKVFQIIPKSSDKCLAIILNSNITLLDSYCFTGESLSNLADTLLKSGKNKFKAVQQTFKEGDVNLLLKGKGKKLLV